MSNIPDKFCFHCGDLDPEYTVEDYARRCTACGQSTVVELVEAIDILNQQWELGNITTDSIQDHIDEEFNTADLEFESQLEFNFDNEEFDEWEETDGI